VDWLVYFFYDFHINPPKGWNVWLNLRLECLAQPKVGMFGSTFPKG